MAKNLVIVESPAKAATIEKYLGGDYRVVASMGHVRDLPASKLGVAVDEGFAPTYVIPPKARKNLKLLKDSLKDKKTVYLATDLDREGEAIAWHISEALDLKKAGVAVERITFDEITKTAITEAIKHPRSLDVQLVDAQQARRVLDRLVGYTLSPLLWKKIYKGLSAGRVQSVALRLVVDRERERQAFKPVEYWSIKALLEAKGKTPSPITANLVGYAGKKIEKMTLENESQAQEITEGLRSAQYVVADIEKKPVKRRPQPPYTTSSLQQDAVNRLGMSSKRIMQLAQKLYEAGHITYMRTDSVALASAAVADLREYIGQAFGSDYLPAKPNTYVAKAKNAQEAHEAIRPTDPKKEASQVSDDAAAQKLYDLIRNRTLACQMKEAELEQTAVTINAGEGVFRANGQRVVFPGFLAATRPDDKDEILPLLEVGEILSFLDLLSEQHFTEPPARYSEATLIKALEEQGIGRPSTYAPTIGTLMERSYIRVEQRRLIPEEVGFLVTDLLVKHFPNIVDLSFTATMEEQLDRVAVGEMGYSKVLEDFWQPFHKQVEENADKIEKVKTEEETDIACPTCGSPMLIKHGRFGKFLACSKFPECKTTQPINVVEPTGLICPHCGKPMVEKRARRGIFYGCSGYPDCKVAVWKKEQMPKKIEELEKEGVAVPFKKEALAGAEAAIAAAVSTQVAEEM